jgi:glucuronokinase
VRAQREEGAADASFPLLWLSYSPDPSDSGKIHNDVKQRWLRGDEEVVAGMAQFGAFAARGKAAVQAADWRALGELMNENFALRRKLYSDEARAAHMREP